MAIDILSILQLLSHLLLVYVVTGLSINNLLVVYVKDKSVLMLHGFVSYKYEWITTKSLYF